MKKKRDQSPTHSNRSTEDRPHQEKATGENEQEQENPDRPIRKQKSIMEYLTKLAKASTAENQKVENTAADQEPNKEIGRTPKQTPEEENRKSAKERLGPKPQRKLKLLWQKNPERKVGEDEGQQTNCENKKERRQILLAKKGNRNRKRIAKQQILVQEILKSSPQREVQTGTNSEKGTESQGADVQKRLQKYGYKKAGSKPEGLINETYVP